ncbi:MAG: hypothetical protein ACWGQW_08460, partial [bacterium]
MTWDDEAGVGLCSYGGYHYEADPAFNLDTYLKRNPGRTSVKPDLDPSLESNQRWWREVLDWILDHFEIAGVNYEMGDFIVNPSDSAAAARSTLAMETNGDIQDIVMATSALLDYAYAGCPDGTFVNALYRG